MSSQTPPATAVDRLAQHLLGGVDDHVLAGELGAWLVDSTRFRAFADGHRDKIRKKLRGAMNTDARRDVRAAVEAAYELLATTDASSSPSRRMGRGSPARTSRSPSAAKGPSTSRSPDCAGRRTRPGSGGPSWRSSANSHRVPRTRYSSRSRVRRPTLPMSQPRARRCGRGPTTRTRRSSPLAGSMGRAGSTIDTCGSGPCSSGPRRRPTTTAPPTWINRSARIPLPIGRYAPAWPAFAPACDPTTPEPGGQEGTTAIASISTRKSGWARPVTKAAVITGGSVRSPHSRWNAA